MTMKLPRKLLSCLLVIAICITTVFGCLITASAEAAPSYTIADGVINADLTEATVDVTFNVPSGMSVGYFDVANYNNGYASVTAEVKDGTPDDIDVFVNTDAADLDEGDLAIIGFQVMGTEKDDSGEDVAKLYTSVTLTLTFTFAGGTATKGNEYEVAINDLDFSGRYAAVTGEWSGAAGVIKTGCDHVVTVDEDYLIKTDSVNGYSVYSDSSCSVCGDPDNELGYQVVPTKTPGKVVYWSGNVADGIADDTSATDATKGTEENPIIINSAEELAYLATIQTDAANATTGKYYKVADGIEAIVLQPESAAAEAIMSLTTANQVKNYFENGNIAEPKPWVSNGWKSATAVYPFAGNFDGNGVTIYGMYFSKPSDPNTYTGLFSYVAGDPKVENVTIANAYLVSSAHMGAVSSYLQTGNVNGTYNKIALENCAVINSYMESHANKFSKTAALLTGSMVVRELKNCIVYGNNARNVVVHNAVTNKTGFDLTLVAAMTNDNQGNQDNFTNVVSLGTIPYSAHNYGYYTLCSTTTPFTNVYTDVSLDKTLYKISDADTDDVRLEVVSSTISDTVINSLTATTASQVKTQSFVDTLNANDGNADADVWQLDAITGYPTFAQDVAEPGSTGIVETWGDAKSTLTGEATEHVISGTAESTWYDNTFELLDTSAENSESNPYIIDSAEGLAWLASKAGATETEGKWYKVADGIKAFNMNTKVDMSGDMTAAEVEAALNTTCQMKTWWNAVFAGNFDGNGVTIYGLQAYNTQYGGSGALFSSIKGGITIKNLTIKNSFFRGDNAGSLFGTVSSTSNQNIKISNIVAANNAIYCTRLNSASSNAGALFGTISWNNTFDMDNCLVYGNSVRHIGSATGYEYTSENKQVSGSGFTVSGYDITYGLYGTAGSFNSTNSTVDNCIVLDCFPHSVNWSYASLGNMTFKNVYTNMAGTTIVNTDYQRPSNTLYLKDAAVKVVNTITTSLDANGKYSYVFSQERTGVVEGDTTSEGGTMTEATGSFIATTADEITGLAASDVVTTLNTANDGKVVWSATANGYPTPMPQYADTINSVSSKDLMLKAVNLTYNEGGNFNLNFHYEPAYTGFAPELYVAQADLSGFTKLTAQESSYAGNGLSDDALMYVIENISAREIADTMLPTVVAANGDQAVWGKTEAISVKDYAIDVINGEAVYTEDATEEEVQQDKNVAAALINYGEAAKNALAQGYDGNAGSETIYWDGKTYTKPTDTDAAGNILINNAEELAYVALKATVDETTGNNYKIADGISNVILQPESSVDGDKLMGLTNNAQVKDYLTGKTEWRHQNGIFNGNFDGNGVTIYGLYQEEAACGLFPQVDGGTPNDDGKDTTGITIKNISLKNSYMNTAWRTGAIFGYSHPNTSGKKVNGTINIEGCVVANCYMTNSDSNANNKGMFTGANSSEELHVRNCLVYNNYYTVQLKDGNGNVTGTKKLNFLGGAINTQENRDAGLYSTIENSILLDISPNDGTKGYNLCTVNTFDKVYTNVDYQVTTDTTDKDFYYQSTDIDSVTTEDAQGSAAATNMPNLDWSKWAYGFAGEYPTPITAAVSSDEEVISCYSGTPATAFSDTAHDGSSAENAIVIATADEFAYLANGADGNTAGKYYAIDPSIDTMVLQSSDYADTIMALDSASAVKKYFENTAPSGAKINWATSASSTTCFAGTLNGNGATIYGMYSTAYNQYGLFPYSYNITLENIAIKNSYVYGDKAGVIVGYAGSNAGTITFNNCEVANNVAIASRFNDGMAYGGVLIGYFQDSTYNNTFLTVDNCVIYGNSATHTESYTSGEVTATYDTNYGLYGVVKGSATDNVAVKISDSIVLDTLPFAHDNVASKAFNYGTFENVYTNMLGQTFVNKNYNGGIKTYTLSSTVNDDGTVVISSRGESTKDRTLAAGSLISISAADVIGDNAKTNASALGWVDNGGVWYTGNAWGYPSLTEKAGVMPTANQMAFDGLTMTNYDDYLVNEATNPNCYMYATSLNLKANPYIAFTFAFQNEYRDAANKANVNVTLTTADGTEYTTTADQMTNNAGAGRYHLYRFTDVPVEYLCEDISVKVEYNGTTTELGTFSVEGFALDIQNAYKQDPCDYYAVRVEAAKALLYYTQMINARYGA